MKIIKFTEFIKEELINDTPESYIDIALKQLKKKIDKMFEYQDYEEGNEEEPKKSIKKAKKDSKDKLSFKDLGVRLESSEISKYSKMYDNLTVKFSDTGAWYSLYIAIDLKEALPKDPNKDFSYDDIEKCFIKFKKYDRDSDDVVGQITKNVDMKSIDEDFLVDLKIEIDDKFGDDEEFSIETE